MASPDKTPLERIGALISDCRFRYRTQPSLPVLELCDLVEAEVVRLQEENDALWAARENFGQTIVRLQQQLEREQRAADVESDMLTEQRNQARRMVVRLRETLAHCTCLENQPGFSGH